MPWRTHDAKGRRDVPPTIPSVVAGAANGEAVYNRLFPQAPRGPLPPHALPFCGARLRIFTYNVSIEVVAWPVETMGKRQGNSSCDWQRGPCVEYVRQAQYSRDRQYAAEVPILAKFLRLQQTDDPETADLFVVPFFASSFATAVGEAYMPKGKGTDNAVRRLLSSLVHFTGKRQRRHVFLASRDRHDVNARLLSAVESSGAFLLHYGRGFPARQHAPTGQQQRSSAQASPGSISRLPASRGPHEIVVPPNDAGFGIGTNGTSLAPLSTPPGLVFLMISPLNRMRVTWLRQMTKLADRRPGTRIAAHWIGKRVKGWRDRRVINMHTRAVLPLTSMDLHRAMEDSLLCPILMGDLPYQHRFFDAAVAGCLPVWVRTNVTLNVTSSQCELWSYDERWTDDRKAYGHPEGYACANRTYPFPHLVNYKNFGVFLDADGPGDSCRSKYECKTPRSINFTREVLVLSALRAELLERRRSLERVRSLFVYDWTGASFDAFSAILHEMCRILGADAEQK
jgi:hypothetical protein